jgi:undecaprenyl-diphosphatase
MAGVSFVAAGFTQFAAGNFLGKLSDHILLQFAGSFVNHFLPFSLGGVNLITRYYKKLSQPQTQAIVMSTIPIIFGVITTFVTVAIISPVTLVIYFNKLHAIHLNKWAVIGVIAAVIIIIIAAFIYRKKIKDLFFETLSGLKSIQNLKQLAFLLIGSLCITLTTATVLYFSILTIHGSTALVAIFALYVTSALVSNIAPTPGGIGATEAFLVVGLTALKFSLPQAVAITLIYRLLTFWLPIIPGGIALHLVNKRKIVDPI